MERRARQLGIVGILIACVLTFGCSTAEDEPGEQGAEALAQNETEAFVLIDEVPSANVAVTGVDTWRLSVVRKQGMEGEFLAAIGSKNHKDVLDIIIANTPSGEPQVRIEGKTAADVTPAFRQALVDDLAKVCALFGPADEANSSSTSTSTRPLDYQDEVEDACGKFSKNLIKGLYMLSVALTVVGCTAAVVSAGAGAGLCVVSAAMTYGTLKESESAAAEYTNCLRCVGMGTCELRYGRVVPIIHAVPYPTH